MMSRKVVSLLSRDEKKLIYAFRVMHPYARDLLLRSAESYAGLERQRRGPVPCNLLLFPRTEATGRAAADRIGKGKGHMPPSRPTQS